MIVLSIGDNGKGPW